MDSVDREDVLWMLEMIRLACRRNALSNQNEDWKGISEAAHLCLHYIGETCTSAECTGLDIKLVLQFVNRYS